MDSQKALPTSKLQDTKFPGFSVLSTNTVFEIVQLNPGYLY